MSDFDTALKWVLEDEGGNDDDPQDHGGRTSRGITQREYDAWREEQRMPSRDVWTASDDEIATIYHDEYWAPLCPTLRTGMDYVIFDMNVNAGPHRCIVLAQRALSIAADGRVGPITRLAFARYDVVGFIKHFGDVKRAFYRSLGQPRFLRGWLNRVDKVEARAIGMLGGAR